MNAANAHTVSIGALSPSYVVIAHRAFFAAVVNVGCIFSTFANERYSRTLFTINLSLVQHRDELLTERDHLRSVRSA